MCYAIAAAGHASEASATAVRAQWNRRQQIRSVARYLRGHRPGVVDNREFIGSARAIEATMITAISATPIQANAAARPPLLSANTTAPGR